MTSKRINPEDWRNLEALIAEQDSVSGPDAITLRAMENDRELAIYNLRYPRRRNLSPEERQHMQEELVELGLGLAVSPETFREYQYALCIVHEELELPKDRHDYVSRIVEQTGVARSEVERIFELVRESPNW